MLTQQYSEQQRRAVNLVWTAAADYRFEPRFLALRTDGAPDFYMNCVIGYVHKWFGDDMPARLFASWAGDVRQAMLDDLAWLALENAAYERELPQRPALEELRAAHAAEFFSMEYQLSRQEWMNKNQLVYTLQSARWKGVLGERPPALNPWEKKLARAGQGGMVEAANALRARLRSNEREETDRDYIESCFGRSIYGPQQLALRRPAFQIHQIVAAVNFVLRPRRTDSGKQPAPDLIAEPLPHRLIVLLHAGKRQQVCVQPFVVHLLLPPQLDDPVTQHRGVHSHTAPPCGSPFHFTNRPEVNSARFKVLPPSKRLYAGLPAERRGLPLPYFSSAAWSAFASAMAFSWAAGGQSS